MNMKKRALSACLAGAVVCGTVTPAMAVDVKNMTDVEKDAWYYQYVKYVTNKEYMVGTSATTFAPTELMSRGMFVTALASMDKADVTNKQSPFVDVSADAWYAGQVKWAADNKVVAGISSTEFAPEQPVTREDMCVIMSAYIKYMSAKNNKTYKTTEKEIAFTDNDQISGYAKEAVKLCQMYGLVDGMPDGSFAPHRLSTRAEVAVVLKQLSALVYGSTGGGGGSGGSQQDEIDTTVETKQYVITGELTLPAAISKTSLILQTKPYDVKITTVDNKSTGVKTVVDEGDQAFAAVAQDMVNGENEQTIKNAVKEMMNKALGKTKTVEIDGKSATVSVSEEGVISSDRDLSEYYQKAMDRYEDAANRAKYMEKLGEALKELGHEEALNEELAGKLYDLNDPSIFLTDNGDGTLTMVTNEVKYLEHVQENVEATCAFYDDLDETREFYAALVEQLNDRYVEETNDTDLQYEVNGEVYEMIVDDKGMFVDRLDQNFDTQDPAHRVDVVLVEGNQTVTQDTYDFALNMLINRVDRVDEDVLPTMLPAKLLGNYKLVVTLDQL